jgi:glycosyltransferase involved in cell wall biosynthesis
MRTVFFDATRLFVRGSRFSPTGIDRVVLAYARWLLKRGDVDLRPVVTARGVVWQMPRLLLAGIAERTEFFKASTWSDNSASSSWIALKAALHADPIESSSGLRSKSGAGQIPSRVLWHASVLGRSLWRLRPIGPVAADAIYLNVSHTGLGDARVLRGLASRHIRNVIMVHDLIPIDYPEFCAPGARERHLRRMDGIIGSTALVIANSKTTAKSLEKFAQTLALPCPPTSVVYLGIEDDFLSRPPSLSAARPYFVCVGTLEARKNLAFLLVLWRRLAERFGVDAPRLVLVGRRGWENESVLDHLERSEAAAKLVHEVSDLHDRELATLISSATALLAPSLAEGFDLPVVEAMALGTPVIASDIPVHRELAASARLIDPLDGPTWLGAITSAKPGQRGPIYRAQKWGDHFSAIEKLLFGDA